MELPGRCTLCGGQLEILEIRCKSCNTVMKGNFSKCILSCLSPEQKSFVLSFIKCRGNIREMEKELGISYPTVRNKLEETAAALGFMENKPDTQYDRLTILKMLEGGGINTDEALNLLDKLD